MTKLSSFLIFFLFFTQISKAQNNGGDVDFERLHFGFTFQYINSEYKIYKDNDWASKRFTSSNGIQYPAGALSLNSISAPKNPGFGLGFVSDLRVGTHGNLRFTPVLTFNEQSLKYYYHRVNADTSFLTATKSNMVEFPLGFKLKSDQRGNFRAYVLGGVKYSRDITGSKKSDNAGIDNELLKLVKYKRSYLSWEAAIGFDLYFEYFKMSPEIKFSQTFGDILDRNDRPNMYNQPLDKLFLRTFQFSLYFE